MKDYLVILEKNAGTVRQLGADVEFHETDCPNLARKIFRQNKHNGQIIVTKLQHPPINLAALLALRHELGMTTQHTVHIKRAGRNRE